VTTPDHPSTVLVVDDDKGVCDVMAMTIEGAGYETIKARSGEKAIEVVEGRGGELALVVLDMTMQGLDGPNTWLAIHALRTELPFLLVSGDPSDSVRAALNSQGIRPDDPTIRSFLKKPFLPCDLQDAVREALGE
jgi:CheY-like chemotaxis protein